MSEKKCCCSPKSNREGSAIKPINIKYIQSPKKDNFENMVKIPGGKFLMGTDYHKAFADDAEGPVREHELSSFYIDKYAVSNGDFYKFIKETSYKTESEKYGWSFVFHMLLNPTKARELQLLGRCVQDHQWWIQVEGACWWQPEGVGSNIKEKENHPVVHISHSDALAYCSWAGKRLATEAEWEYAARGALEQNLYPWGNELTPNDQHKCNIWQGEFPTFNSQEDGFIGTAPVDQYNANGYGLYNMVGNVWEWTADWWTNNPSDKGGYNNPQGPSSDSQNRKVMKGGSFLCHDSYCNRYRVAARTSNTIDSSTSNLGFRCVKDI